ncbi:MAG: 5-(carboxyamino)imidazole ribonucleotide synthase [Alphaproteobacteria bacterium]|nr:5-(carboxyamino)imidazole ribonucleotide synthase [Alphaproteobacteria bacterium]
MKTIGILGAGQLGKMLAEAAAKLGFATHVFAPDSDPIAASVATHFTKAEYTDLPALQKFADSVNVITLEFENVPVAPMLSLRRKPESSGFIHPSPEVLEISQHRVREKTLAGSLGIGTAPFAAVSNSQELEAAIQKIGTPGILKTCTMGYDGKGQWKVTGDRSKAIESLPDTLFLSPATYIYEGFISFEKEISVIVARSISGEVQCFEPVENVHKNHILHTTTAPANIGADVAAKAMAIATKLANALEVVGLLAVELFVTDEGDVLMNEVAPRPHNSGHWTMDGCNVSQFEQAIRAVAGLPLIRPERTAKKVVMTNLIGEDVNDVSQWKKQGAHIHIYGKKEVRAGRKMGHVTQIIP